MTAVILLVVVSFFSNDYILTILFFANIFAITAASWDILAGYAGQLSFGNVAFYGVGGYSVALLSKYFGSQSGLSWLGNPIVATCVGVLVSAILSTGIGFSAIRLRGPYLAIVTFMVSGILQGLVIIYANITGGQFGLTLAQSFSSARFSYYVSLILMATSIFVMILITSSRFGLYFKAIRDDEIEAQATGINPTKYKLLAFIVSSSFTSVAGSLYVLAFGIVNWDVFGYSSSLLWIEMSVIGGSGTIVGSIFGSYFIQVLVEVLRVSQTYSLIAFAVIFVIVIRFFPQGLFGLIRKILRWK